MAYDRLLSSVPEQEREKMLSESVLIEVRMEFPFHVEKAGDGVEQGEVSAFEGNEGKADGEERTRAERAGVNIQRARVGAA